MAYFTGKNLDSRAAALGLTQLQNLLGQVRNNLTLWPGPCTIKPTKNQGEDRDGTVLRAVLYSLLHQAGVKEQFSISKNPAETGFILDRRYDPADQVEVNFPQTMAEEGDQG